MLLEFEDAVTQTVFRPAVSEKKGPVLRFLLTQASITLQPPLLVGLGKKTVKILAKLLHSSPKSVKGVVKFYLASQSLMWFHL